MQEHDDLLMEKILEEFYCDIEEIEREDKSIAKFLKLWKEKDVIWYVKDEEIASKKANGKK